MLIRDHGDEPASPRYKPHLVGNKENMTITYWPELALFLQHVDFARKILTITYSPPNGESKKLTLPLEPGVTVLDTIDVSLHQSPAQAYKMNDNINEWFSSCFGFPVLLAYLDRNQRPILGNLSPNILQNKSPSSQSWLSSITSNMPSPLASKQVDKEGLKFSDCAAYLVVTEESTNDVSSRLSGDMEVDITKFRPNVVLGGATKAYEEDYWGAINIDCRSEKEVGQTAKIILTANCLRCVSLNVDYSTGQAAKGEEGTVLKKLMKDRRVDKGVKYSPVFGRYGFSDASSIGQTIAVGGEVTVSKTNAERTTFGKQSH